MRDAWITALVIAFIALAIHRVLDFEALRLVIGVALGYILAYTINDYYDAEEDTMSDYKSKHNFFVQNKLSPKLAIILLTSILGILLYIFSTFGTKGIGVFSISVLILWAYSSGPFHLRNKPMLDVVVHAIFIISFPYFLILYLLDLEWLSIDYFLLSIFIIGSAIIQLENQIRDYDLDVKNGNNTTITIGLRNSNNLIKILTITLIAIVIYGLFVIDEILVFLPFGLIYSPILYQRLTGSVGQVRTEKQIRIVIALTVSYCVLLLLYFIFK
ncbi:MAG: prenyltransferase [Candidatus Heimdallarchaeota archaeon]|nr:prenyltransferase [Candidatus Heimdallarchaeota archaeon]